MLKKMLNSSTFVSNGPLAQSVEHGASNVKSCVRDSYRPDFTFYLDSFDFLTSFRTFIASKLLIWTAFVSSGLLAQPVERCAHKSKVMCSMLKE